MKVPTMRENPRINPCTDNCGVLDELQAPARRAAASITPRGLQLGADLLLHRL
jgi:hypothetical protein